MDMSLSELWELVMDRKAWHAVIHGLGGPSRDSTGFGAIEEGLISSGGRNLRVRLHF